MAQTSAIVSPLLYVHRHVRLYSDHVRAPVHVHGKRVIVLQVVSQKIRNTAAENDRRFFARLEEVAGNHNFKRLCILGLCDVLDDRLFMCAEKRVVVVWNVVVHTNQSITNPGNDTAVYFLWDCVAQCIEEPVQNLHWSYKRQGLSPVHDPVVAGRTRKYATAILTRLNCRLRVRLLTLVQHIPHGAVENVSRRQHALFREHVTHILTRDLLSTIRAYIPTEKAGAHMTGKHYECPRICGRGLHVVVITNVVQHHGAVSPRVR